MRVTTHLGTTPGSHGSPDNSAAPNRPTRLILVAVNDSAPAQWAVDIGGQLASGLSAKVLLLHVVNTRLALSDETGLVEARWLDDMRRDGERALRDARARVPVSIEVEQCLREGEPDREIVAAALEWGPTSLSSEHTAAGDSHDFCSAASPKPSSGTRRVR